jgi:hypothetical protein
MKILFFYSPSNDGKTPALGETVNVDIHILICP